MANVRQFIPGDVPQIVSLLRNQMGLERYTDKYFFWKYGYSVTASARPLGLVAIAGGAIVGFAAFFPYCMCTGEILWNVDDVIVRKDHRRRGLFTQLMTYGLGIIDGRGEDSYLFASSMAKQGYARLGYTDAFDLDYRVHIPKWETLLGSKGKLANMTGKVLDRAVKWLYPQPAHLEGITFNRIESFPQAVRLDTPIGNWRMIRKRPDFLNWRFFAHPWNNYDCYLARDRRRVVGYVVFEKCNMMDFHAIGMKYFRPLFEFARSRFVETETKVANTYMHCPEAVNSVIRESGFVKWDWKMRPFGLYPQKTLMYRESPSSKVDFKNLRQWFFKMADMDCGD